MLAWRASSSAFGPSGAQEILATSREVVGIRRSARDGSTAEVYINVAGEPASIDTSLVGDVRGFRVADHRPGSLTLGPWGVAFVLGHTS